MKHRSLYLDNICSLLIFHMIYTEHIACASGCFDSITIKTIQLSLSFFMSWFFFKGGMMHKESTFKEIHKKSARRLFKPYIFFLFLGLLLDSIIKFVKNDNLTTIFFKQEYHTFLSTSILWSTAASWFLLSLFVVRLAFFFLGPKVHPIILTVVFALVAYIIYVMNCYFLPCYWGNICHGLSLYSLGYYLKDKQFNKYYFILALSLYALKFYLPASIDFRSNMPSSDSLYFLAVIYGMAGCIVINNVFRQVANVKIPFVTYIGYNSMLYFLIHYPVMHTTRALFWEPVEGCEPLLKFLYLASIVTISLFIAEFLFRNKRLRIIIGG